jgi:Tol biopolymer transport system component
MKKNLLNFMRLLSLTAVTILISPVMIYAQTGRTAFSGTWALNSMESSPIARSSSGEIVVKQEANLLTTTTTSKDGMSVVVRYTLDGKESINNSDEGERSSTAKFSADGKTLTILTRYYIDDMEKTEQDVWSLRDTKTLSVVNTASGTSGDEVTRFVYNKKEW